MALLEGSAGSIDEVYELYPWRVGDGGKAVNIPILDPTLGIPEKSVIENVYIIADINELLNNPDIPKNTLILGYGGYL